MSDNAGAGPASPHQEFTVKLAKQGLTFEAGCAQTIILQEAGDKTACCASSARARSSSARSHHRRASVCLVDEVGLEPVLRRGQARLA